MKSSCTKITQNFSSLKKLYRIIKLLKSHALFFCFMAFSIPLKTCFFLFCLLFLFVYMNLNKYHFFVLLKHKYFDILIDFSKVYLIGILYFIMFDKLYDISKIVYLFVKRKIILF